MTIIVSEKRRCHKREFIFVVVKCNVAMWSAKAIWTDAQHQAAGTLGRDTVKVVHSIRDLLYNIYYLIDFTHDPSLLQLY